MHIYIINNENEKKQNDIGKEESYVRNEANHMEKNLIELMELLEKDRAVYAILKHCPYEILRKIQIKHYREKEFALEQGEIHNTFYIIVEGCVDIYVESEHGKKYFLTSYGKGQYLGELEVFRQIPYVSGVEAQGKVTVLEIEREVLLSWIQMDSNFSEYMIKTLCDSTYFMCNNMGKNTLYSLKQRLCQYFIENTDKSGEFRVPMRTETLGEQMAVTQRSINRVIKQLKEKEIIEIDKNSVTIKDYSALLKEREKK